jgi:hypothetical protein
MLAFKTFLFHMFFVDLDAINIKLEVAMCALKRKRNFITSYSKRVFTPFRPGTFNAHQLRGPAMNSNSEFFIDDLLHEQEHRFVFIDE